MRKNLFFPIAIFISLAIFSCGGKETASSVAQRWCELNGKVTRAADGDAKEAAKDEREKYEKKIEEKYKADQAFMNELEKEVEKCEAASEGR